MENIDKTWKGFYKISGILWILGVPLYIASVIFENMSGYTPGMPVEASLQVMAANKGYFLTSMGLVSLMNLFSIVATFGLYFSLKHVCKNYAFTGLILLTLGTLGMLVVHMVNMGAPGIAEKYLALTDQNMKAVYIGSIEVISGMINYIVFLSLIIGGIGGVFLGTAMLAGVYDKKASYLVIAAGALEAIGSAAIITPAVPVFILLTAFFLFLVAMVLFGLKLIAIDREI